MTSFRHLVTDKALPQLKLWPQVELSISRCRAELHQRLPQLPRWMSFTGWRMTIVGSAVLSLFSLTLNTIVLLWASFQPKDSQTGAAIIYNGSHDSAQNVFLWSHLGINVLSTLLLGSSNATMQCLMAPTRQEIDKAHAKGQWLDIGISGFRNWSALSTWRKVVWVCLALSSVPLHLVYNSAIFSTVAVSEYYAVIATHNFLLNTTISIDHVVDLGGLNEGQYSELQFVVSGLQGLANSSQLIMLENDECIRQYSNPLNAQYSNLIVVTALEFNDNSPVLDVYTGGPFVESSTTLSTALGTWACYVEQSFEYCYWDKISNQHAPWSVSVALGHRGNSTVNATQPITSEIAVDYCLAQPFNAASAIGLSQGIMRTVVIFNSIKTICYLLVITKEEFAPLITLGDALKSFLIRPSKRTDDRSPLSADDVRASDDFIRKFQSKILAIQSPSEAKQRPRHDFKRIRKLGRIRKLLPLTEHMWRQRRQRWFSGAGTLRWILTYAMCLMLWTVAWVILSFTFLNNPNPRQNLQILWENGFGNYSPGSIIVPTQGLSVIANVLIANSPQIIVSLAYILYNGLLTCLLLSREFTTFGQKRHGLRVSDPEGLYQRSTYWLSLPYRFSIPLLGVSAAFHWILSQTLFLVEGRVYNSFRELDSDPNHSISLVGWSPLSLIITMSLGSILMALPLLLGLFRFDGSTPIVESCSLAISAACSSHRGQTEAQALLKYGSWSEAGKEYVGLSSRDVTSLKEGRSYTSRPYIKDLAAELLSDFNIQMPKKNRVLRNLLPCLQLLQFSLGTIVAVFVATTYRIPQTEWCSAKKGPSFIQAFRMTVACVTTILIVVRKLISHHSRIHSVVVCWDVLVEILFLLCWLFVLISMVIQVWFPVIYVSTFEWPCGPPPLKQVALATAAFVLSCPATWYLWLHFG